MELRRLTERQKRFVDFYVETGNAMEAARRAGYKQPQVQGAENLEKPRIKNAIAERMKELENARIATANEVLQNLTAIIRGEVEADIKDRLKAMELLLKRYPTPLDEREQLLRIKRIEREAEAGNTAQRVVVVDAVPDVEVRSYGD